MRSRAWMSRSPRDTPEKIYVQHKLWDRRAELIEWLDGGALSMSAVTPKRWRRTFAPHWCAPMPDVKALSPEAAEQAVVTLEREKRYLQDTY